MKPESAWRGASPRIIVHVWFPWLAADRLQRNGVVRPDQTLVLTGRHQGADHVVAVGRRAQHRGVQAGMRLADARALCPDLVSHDWDPVADSHDLRHLALWARRYCPLTAPDHGEAAVAGPLAAIAHDGNGIWLDIAGAAHLHGGVRPLLADLLQRLRRAGLRGRLAVAPTCGAAWALARYGRGYGSARQPVLLAENGALSGRRLANVLAPLPLAALRLETRLCTAMAAAGLRQIGDIIGMPRAPLANRFGAGLIERLDAALGHINESFSPIAPPRPLLTVRQFAEPLLAPDAIAAMVRQLGDDIARILSETGLATRRLRLGWQRVDGTTLLRDTHFSRPSRDAAAFHRLLAAAGQAIDPEFGLEKAWIEALDCSPQTPVSRRFNEGLSAAETYASLVDRLVARLGYGAVLQLRSRACWPPEAAQYLALPEMDKGGSGLSGSGGNAMPSATAPPRPVRLLVHPQPLAVVALLPDHPPAQFVWRKKTHRVRQASGPERIAPQWWTAPAGSRTRDYFRLQDEAGARFWVYREGLPERGEDVRWFLHGFFA